MGVVNEMVGVVNEMVGGQCPATLYVKQRPDEH